MTANRRGMSQSNLPAQMGLVEGDTDAVIYSSQPQFDSSESIAAVTWRQGPCRTCKWESQAHVRLSPHIIFESDCVPCLKSRMLLGKHSCEETLMSRHFPRREFLKVAGAAAMVQSIHGAEKPVRIGFVGVGNRGT